MNDGFIAGESGNIKISEDVIASVAALSAKETDGVCELSGGGWTDFLNKKTSKGVRVELIENGAIIDIHITVEYGKKVQEVAKVLQEKAKNAVESMTGLEEIVVNVFVDSIAEKKTEDTDNTEGE